MAALFILIPLTCLLLWVIGEAKSVRWMRIVGVLLLTLTVSASAAWLGGFLRSANATLEVTGALDRYLAAAVEARSAGRGDDVLASIHGLNESLTVTYEHAGVVRQFDDATRILSIPATDPSTMNP